MRIGSVFAFVTTALWSIGASAQGAGTIPGPDGATGPFASMPLSQPHDLKAARKAACERDARLVYRVGRNVADDNWQQKVKDSRRAYIQDCMAKAGFTP